jgi:hypothetical protein
VQKAVNRVTSLGGGTVFIPAWIGFKPRTLTGLTRVNLDYRIDDDLTRDFQSTGRGSIEITFYSPEDFERIVELMGVSNLED